MKKPIVVRSALTGRYRFADFESAIRTNELLKENNFQTDSIMPIDYFPQGD